MIDDLGDHWQKIKQQERQQQSLLEGISPSLPSLTRAQKIQERVRVVGFDWENPQQVYTQLRSEVDEVSDALVHKHKDDVLEEIGDVMFCCVNLIRHLGGDAETVMRESNQKFQNRFQTMESFAQLQNQRLESLSSQQLEELWKKAKHHLAKSR